MSKLSIISINYNNFSGLEKTMNSVISQTSSEFEYIIIDGGSGDNSKELIRGFANDDKRISYWLSESDHGIYDAMNKGILAAKGDYILFLNSGDWLVDNSVIETILSELPDCDIFVGVKVSVRADGKAYIDNDNIESVSFLSLYKSTIQHPSAFIKRTLFEKYGLYDVDMKIVSDWKWYLIVVGLNNASVQFTKTLVSFFDTSGISCNNIELNMNERRQVLEEFVPQSILKDYDNYSFCIDQINRIKRYPLIYNCFWFVERVLFKIEKWKIKYSILKNYSSYKN